MCIHYYYSLSLHGVIADRLRIILSISFNYHRQKFYELYARRSKGSILLFTLLKKTHQSVGWDLAQVRQNTLIIENRMNTHLSLLFCSKPPSNRYAFIWRYIWRYNCHILLSLLLLSVCAKGTFGIYLKAVI